VQIPAIWLPLCACNMTMVVKGKSDIYGVFGKDLDSCTNVSGDKSESLLKIVWLVGLILIKIYF